MDVILYRTLDTPTKVDKTLAGSYTLEHVRFKDDGALDILTPTVVFQTEFSDISAYASYNYMRIPKFQRYYYISDMETSGGLVVIHGEIDYLMSWKNSIIGSSQYISRSEKYRNRYIVDSQLPIHSDHDYYIHNFGENVYYPQCTSVILETVGKGGTTT